MRVSAYAGGGSLGPADLLAVILAMVFLRGQIENIFSNIGNNLT